jgi:hypothetical protein
MSDRMKPKKMETLAKEYAYLRVGNTAAARHGAQQKRGLRRAEAQGQKHC